jgi:RNA-directed DNA polymerase
MFHVLTFFFASFRVSCSTPSLAPVSKVYRAVEKHAGKRLRQWLCAKHKLVWPGTKRYPKDSLPKVLGLVCLTKRTSNLPWATS